MGGRKKEESLIGMKGERKKGESLIEKKGEWKKGDGLIPATPQTNLHPSSINLHPKITLRYCVITKGYFGVNGSGFRGNGCICKNGSGRIKIIFFFGV